MFSEVQYYLSKYIQKPLSNRSPDYSYILTPVKKIISIACQLFIFLTDATKKPQRQLNEYNLKPIALLGCLAIIIVIIGAFRKKSKEGKETK